MKTRLFFSCLLLALLLAPVTASAAKKLYKWVDENGEVHYSESLPPGYDDSGHDVLDSDGLVREENQKLTPEYKPPPPKKQQLPELPRDKSGNPRPRALYSDAETQSRMDAFLLLRYETEQEIDDAMMVEIRQLAYDRRILQTTQTSLAQSYRDRIRVAANKQRAGVPVEENTVTELRQLGQRLSRAEAGLNTLDNQEAQIRAEFGQELERYRRLKREQLEQAEEERAMATGA